MFKIINRSTGIMSFFYLYPVKGDLPTHLLETIVSKRVDFLTSLLKDDTLKFDEYVLEGSVYDNVGHFALCVILIMCNSRQHTTFFARAEERLFQNRLASLSSYDLRLFSKKIIRSLKKLDKLPTDLEPLQKLTQNIILKHIAQHVNCPFHEESCQKYSLNLNFKHCLQLVAKRQVEMSNGMVKLTCGRWKQYLEKLFNKNLQRKLTKTNLEALRNDPRITELAYKIKQEKFNIIFPNSQSSFLTSDSIDKAAADFPPCMLNLHTSLRKTHRLSHDQRFIYSLFLKDIGLPVDEAIKFWRLEYSQTPGNTHPCCHNWEKDEKKYLYGIRHMYGLEGGRKCYTSVNCSRIQSTTNAGTEGGCPFKSFDHTNMTNVLRRNNKQIDNITKELLELKVRKKYSCACIVYLKSTKETKVNCDDNLIYNFAPVKYYNISTATAT